MNKKLSRFDYLFSMIVIFMLICIVAAFFYGVKYGENRMEEKYASTVEVEPPQPQYTAYDQQYLVSFYYSIFLPYREFQVKWFEYLNLLERNATTADPSALMKELERLANKEHGELMKTSMPQSSPLLIDAHTAYLKSLKLFSEGIGKLDLQGDDANQAYEAILNSDFFIESKKYALEGQHDYYAAMVKWNEQFDPAIDADEIFALQHVNSEQWDKLNIITKNYYIAKLLLQDAIFALYYPQDVAIRIDQMLSNGNSQKLQTDQIPELLTVLVNTGAIREQDFLSDKNVYYSNAVLPQLPLFKP